jgi:hypothetical protein
MSGFTHFVSTLTSTSRLTILTIVLLSFIPLLWFEGQAINGVDIDYALFHQDRFFARLQLWDPNFMGGTPRSNNVASLGFILPSALLEAAGIIHLNQAVFYCLLQAAVGFSFYFFMTASFGKCETREHAIALAVSCAFYMTNFYLMFAWVRLQLGITYLIFVPVFLGLIAIGLAGQIRRSTLFALSSLLAIPSSPLGIQPPIIMIVAFFFLIYFLFQSFTAPDRAALKQAVKVWAIASSGFVAGSLFWAVGLVSFIFEAGYNDSAVGKDVYSVSSLIQWTSSILNTQNLVSFFGDIDWFGEWNGQFYFPEFIAHTNSYLGILLPVLIFLTALQSLRPGSTGNRGQISLFFGCYCLFLFLSKGSHPPFGFIYIWMVENIPLFWIQRAPWQKFTLISTFCFSVLLFMAIRHLLIEYRILERLGSAFRIPMTLASGSVTAVILLCVLANHHLYLTGKMFRSASDKEGFHGVYDLGFQQNYPQYLFDAREAVYERGSGNILLLPLSPTNVFTWHYGAATPVSVLLFKQGLFFKSYGEGIIPRNKADRILKTIEEQILSGDVDGFLDALSILGIDTIIQRNDHRINFYGATKATPDYMKQFLREIDVVEARTFGNWDIYFLNKERIKPVLYIPTSITGLDRPTEAFDMTISDAYSEANSRGVFFSSISDSVSADIERSNFQRAYRDAVNNFSGDMDFRQVSNSKYFVRIRSTDPKIPLLLNTNFSEGWIVRRSQPEETSTYRDRGDIFSTERSFTDRLLSQLRESIFSLAGMKGAEHQTSSLANLFANGWVIDNTEGCTGERATCSENASDRTQMHLIVEYAPQNSFNIALFLSCVCFLIAICILALNAIRNLLPRGTG